MTVKTQKYNYLTIAKDRSPATNRVERPLQQIPTGCAAHTNADCVQDAWLFSKLIADTIRYHP